MYELIVLSLLMRFPLHGYLIVQRANETIGPWAKISNGTLYPLLTRLERQGFIARVNEQQQSTQTEQQARTFLITDEGRKRFHQVMMETSSSIGDYRRLFHLKVPSLDLLTSRERQQLLTHYSNYCQTCLLHIKIQVENLEHELVGEKGTSPLFKELALQTMQERARLWQTEVDWTEHLRDLLPALSEQAAGLE